MQEYAIFLSPTGSSDRRPPEVIRDHCAHLDRLGAESRLIAAGPFTDETGGGMIVGSFASLDEAEEFGLPDRAIVAGVVGLGWPEVLADPMPRQAADRVVGWGRWPEHA